MQEPAFYLDRARNAASALQMHLIERDWIRRPYSRLSDYPSPDEAWLKLVDDAGWLYREIPLPEHPDPQHPPIYFTVDPLSKQPVPTEDSLIRAEYVYFRGGARITEDEYIRPWLSLCGWPSLDDMRLPRVGSVLQPVLRG